MTKLRRAERIAVGICAALCLALAIGGIGLFFTSSTSQGSVRGALRGARTQPARFDQWQELHTNLSTALTIVVLAGAGWLMVRVKQDWSGRLGLAALLGFAAVFSGMLLRFDALKMDGTFVDYRGYRFIFDSGFEGASFGGRILGATTFRLMLALHLGFAIATFALLVAGLRDIAQDPRVSSRRAQT